MTYSIEGASIPDGDTKHDFPYTPRKFQEKFLEWVHNENRTQVVTLEAPTGAGKTAAFKQLVKERGQSLLVYPTNALIKDQKETIEDSSIDTKLLTGDTLNKTGLARRDELLGHARRGGYDAIITNPDILQAILQGQYIDYNSKLMQFFNQFDAIVYDEYHFYGQFAASGIALQAKVAAERRNADIVFASATGNNMPSTINELFGFDVHRISCEIGTPHEGSQFRHSIDLKLNEQKLLQDKEKIARNLENYLETTSKKSRAALIFNSAKDSNEFYEFLYNEHKSIFERTEKDNGYDTHGNVSLSEQFDILITTSKSEVGLNYNINQLYMEKPYTASSFVQRIGRAAREEKSKVSVYNIGSVPWPTEQTYEEFIENVYEDLGDDALSVEDMRNLIGLRAAYAMYSREETDAGYNEEIKQDFQDVPNYTKWHAFVSSIRTAANRDYGLAKPPQSYIQLVNVIDNALYSLDTLRGKSLNIELKYPRGNTTDITEYSLLSTVSQYCVEVKNDTLIVSPSRTKQDVLLKVVGSSRAQKFTSYYDLNPIVNTYISKIDSLAQEFRSRDSISPTQIYKFFNIMDNRNLVDIEEIQIGDSTIELE